MAKIIPFRGLRPKPSLAEAVATLPYDVVNDKEARKFKNQPYNFYHVTRSEIDLPEIIDVHSSQVYERAKENLDHMIDEGIMITDAEPSYYIYELEMNGRSQTGLICGSSVDDYQKGIIKKHEFTRPAKELDRINHIKATHAQTGIVFLAYRDNAEVQQLIEEWKSSHEPVNNFIAVDGVRHTFWVMDGYSKVSKITRLFAQDVPATYIADGHHRAASAAKVCEEMRGLGYSINGEESFNYFLTAIFPESQLKILDYNRVVSDLNGLSEAEFLKALNKDFEVSKAAGTKPFRPIELHEFGMYLKGVWYILKVKEGTYTNDATGVLDVTILQQNLLSPILGIQDPRTDKRIDFVGGIRGLDALAERVDTEEAAVAFSCFPVSIAQLFDIADSGKMMPPKSTWFEPKTRDGLVVYMI
ncbi:MAG: DUF1015 family protein [Chitinophagaceae bacterium]